MSPQMLERVCCGSVRDRLDVVAGKVLVGAVVSRLGEGADYWKEKERVGDRWCAERVASVTCCDLFC